MEEEEVVVVGGEGDVLGLLGSQGGLDGCCEGGANVQLGAGQRLSAKQSAQVTYVVDLVFGNLKRVPACALATSVHMRQGKNWLDTQPLICAPHSGPESEGN